jgi:cytochrome P450
MGIICPRRCVECVKTHRFLLLTNGQTQVSSCIYVQNMDPDTFPNPTKYDPDRWMCDPETYKLRDRQMVSFSRGSRGCIGIK